MGNTQSAPTPTPREQYRLSKPKTNASSSNLLALAHQPTERDAFRMPSKTANIDATEAVVTSPSGERRSRPDARPKLRAHLFGSTSGSARNEPLDADGERHCGLGELVSGVRDRLSRSGSPNSQPSSARGSSTNLTNSIGASRLTLVPDSPAPASEETRRLLQDIRAKASTDELAAFSHISSPVEENAPDNPVLSPIRRRSLLTPGIATRVPDDILRKPPPRNKLESQLDRAYYYNPHLSDSSPLARLAVLDLADHGRVSPVARAATPTFHDYGHLGGLKLGTLRVTNGRASPAPSDSTVQLVADQSLAHVDQEGDYFNLSSGCTSESKEDGVVPRYTRWQSGQSLPATSHPFTEESRAVRLGRSIPSANKGGRSTMLSSGRGDHKSSKVDVLLPDGVRTEFTPPIPSNKQRSMSLYGTSDEFTDPTSSIAQEYITELPHTPFLNAEPTVHGHLQILSTTKANEFEDNLFEDESIVVSTQSPSPRKQGPCLAVDDLESEHVHSGSREDALRILDGRTSSTVVQSIRHNSSPRSSAQHAQIPSPTPSELALSKADSGYSSNASLRSLKKDQVSEIASGTETTDRITNMSVETFLSPPKRLPPPPPPADKINAAPPIRSVAYSQTLSAGEPLTLRAANIVKTSDEHRPSLQNTPNSVKSAQEESVSSQIGVTQRKLKKDRPLSQPLPVRYITVQGYRELSQSHIPPVPADVAAKLAQRHRAFPLLEHTFPSLQHTNMKDESATMPPVSVPIRFPSPTKALGEPTIQTKQQSPSAYTQSPSSHDRPPQRRRSSINWVKSKRRCSREREPQEEEYPDMIADFGTVIESLGGSPYDVAHSTLAWTPRLSDSQTWAGPHQMNNEVLRVKATGMDEEAAARFARSRSNTRSQGQLRSPTPLNSNFNDRGGIPGKNIRPTSMIIDAPPVPALPSQIGAAGVEKPKLERPVSVPLRQPPVIVVSAVSDTTESIDTRSAVNKHDKSWEEHRRTWLQRRRSAAEGLLARGQTFQGVEAPAPSTTNSCAAATTARPSFEYVAGRYNGGFSYGYEPGYGLGGSAGTRNTKTDASRKGVVVSRGYGIDLSDVPIFIAKKVNC